MQHTIPKFCLLLSGLLHLELYLGIIGVKERNVEQPLSQLLTECPGLSLPSYVSLDRPTSSDLKFLHV